MNRLFEDSFVRPRGFWPSSTGASWGASETFPFDLYETADDVYVRVAIPGVAPNSIELTVNQGLLTLKCYRNLYNGDEERQYTWHARALAEGEFQLTVALPMQVNIDAAQASYENGIATIRLPKSEEVKPKRIAVHPAPRHEELSAGR